MLNYDELLEAATKRKVRRRSIINYSESDDEQKVKKTRQKRVWTCTKCPGAFITSRKLREHRKTHRKDDLDTQYNYMYDETRNVFSCYGCDVETNTKEEIEEHVLLHEEKFTCDVCNETFVKPYEYSSHLYSHDQTKGFRCPYCKYATSRRTAIVIHINTFHLRKFIYTCELCGKGFNDCVLYKEHSNIHEGVRPFKCVVCEKDFPFSSYLNSHQIRNHKVTIDGIAGANQCLVCSKNFSRKSVLENHMKRHENIKVVHEKKHLCDICGKGFAQTEKLRIHYRVHTGVKPYTCSYCAKSFTKRDYLVMHERVHSGERPYSCEHCGKRFNQSAPLRLHVRSHTGERPYICHLCNNGYISRGVLNLHLKNCPGSSV